MSDERSAPFDSMETRISYSRCSMNRSMPRDRLAGSRRAGIRGIDTHAGPAIWFLTGRNRQDRLALRPKVWTVRHSQLREQEDAPRRVRESVERCYKMAYQLESHTRSVELGQTSYQLKSRLGARAIPMYLFLKHRKPLWNLLLRVLGPMLFPATPLPPKRVFRDTDCDSFQEHVQLPWQTRTSILSCTRWHGDVVH